MVKRKTLEKVLKQLKDEKKELPELSRDTGLVQDSVWEVMQKLLQDGYVTCWGGHLFEITGKGRDLINRKGKQKKKPSVSITI